MLQKALLAAGVFAGYAYSQALQENYQKSTFDFEHSFISEGPMPCSFTLDNHTYDFSSVKSIVSEYQRTDTRTYFMSICAPIQGTTPFLTACNTAKSSLCRIDQQAEDLFITTKIVSSEDSAKKCTITLLDSEDPDGGLSISCQNGSSDGCENNAPRFVVFQALCDAKAEGIKDFQVMASGENECQFVGSFTSSAACSVIPPQPVPGGLSGVTVFFIILAVLIVLYIIIGCVYNAHQGETTAYRRCPNVEFWVSIPTLFVTCYKRIYYKFNKHHQTDYHTEYENDHDEATANQGYQAGNYGTLA